jgi:hypothetical protein
MSLEQTLKEIKTLKPFAEEDLENLDPATTNPATLGGRRGRKMQALEQITRLKRDYKQQLMSSALFLVVVGSERQNFEHAATGNKFGLFSADPEQFYNDLAGRVAPALYQGKESVSGIFDVLGRHLEDKANELDLASYPQLIFKESYTGYLTNVKDFTRLVKRAVNDQMGAEIVGIQAVNSILDTAVERGHAGKTTPIILSTDDLQLAKELLRDLGRLSSRVFLVQAGTAPIESTAPNNIAVTDVNQGSVKSVLAQINKTIKSNG